jgi:ubiquinone/menaquinone biosynthesis C-methylase UbiE
MSPWIDFEAGMIIRVALYVLIGSPLVFLVLHTLVRIIRHFHKFPIPEFLANVIDNPLRRRIQPPDETPARHGIEPGMTVLEVGPGNGTYTMAAARALGDRGHLVTVDIEPKMIDRVRSRAEREGVRNVEARVADVYELPFGAGTFHAIYMTAVIGEIPSPERALREFHRVLAPTGTLAFSEILLDPDYPLSSTLMRMAAAAGFRLRKRVGSFFYYTLVFEKALAAAP